MCTKIFFLHSRFLKLCRYRLVYFTLFYFVLWFIVIIIFLHFHKGVLRTFYRLAMFFSRQQSQFTMILWAQKRVAGSLKLKMMWWNWNGVHRKKPTKGVIVWSQKEKIDWNYFPWTLSAYVLWKDKILHSCTNTNARHCIVFDFYTFVIYLCKITFTSIGTYSVYFSQVLYIRLTNFRVRYVSFDLECWLIYYTNFVVQVWMECHSKNFSKSLIFVHNKKLHSDWNGMNKQSATSC